MSTPQRLSSGTARLFQTWSRNARLAAILAPYVAQPGITRLLWRDRRFDYEFWSRLVEHEAGLRHTLAVPLLEEMVEETIKNKAAALNRFTDEQRGVTGSKLALALYRAWRGGMQAAQIIDIIDSVSVNNTKLIHKINFLELDNVLREFESMLAYPAADAEGQLAPMTERQMRAEDTLFELWELICNGGLGQGYGRDFRRYLDERLEAETASRKRARRRLRRTLRKRFRAFISRRRARRAVAAAQGQTPGGWPAPLVPAAEGGSLDLTVPERAAPLPRAELVPVRAIPAAEPTQPLVKRGWWRRLFQRVSGGRGKRAARKRVAEGQDVQGGPR